MGKGKQPGKRKTTRERRKSHFPDSRFAIKDFYNAAERKIESLDGPRCFQFPRRDRGRTKERTRHEDVRLGTHSIVWRETVSRWRGGRGRSNRQIGPRVTGPDLWIPGDELPRNCLVYRRPTARKIGSRVDVNSYFSREIWNRERKIYIC